MHFISFIFLQRWKISYIYHISVPITDLSECRSKITVVDWPRSCFFFFSQLTSIRLYFLLPCALCTANTYTLLLQLHQCGWCRVEPRTEHDSLLLLLLWIELVVMCRWRTAYTQHTNRRSRLADIFVFCCFCWKCFSRNDSPWNWTGTHIVTMRTRCSIK